MVVQLRMSHPWANCHNFVRSQVSLRTLSSLSLPYSRKGVSVLKVLNGELILNGCCFRNWWVSQSCWVYIRQVIPILGTFAKTALEALPTLAATMLLVFTFNIFPNPFCSDNLRIWWMGMPSSLVKSLSFSFRNSYTTSIPTLSLAAIGAFIRALTRKRALRFFVMNSLTKLWLKTPSKCSLCFSNSFVLIYLTDRFFIGSKRLNCFIASFFLMGLSFVVLFFSAIRTHTFLMRKYTQNCSFLLKIYNEFTGQHETTLSMGARL